MQLLCNGFALDLMSGAKLSFKKTNPLFAFDAIACERTQAFDIPATDHNENVLQFAKIPAFGGNGMRRRFNAELQDGTVVKRGYLHVDAYANGTYKGVFVTGELLGLQNIKNLGKLSEIIQCTEAVQYGQTFINTPHLPQRANDAWAVVSYVKNGSLCPSSRIMAIVDKVTAATGVRVAYPRTFGGGLRVIVGTPKGLQLTTAQLERNWVRDFVEQSTTAIYPVVNNTAMQQAQTDVSTLFGVEEAQVIQYRTGYESGGRLFSYTYKGRVQHIVARQPLTITFAENWPVTRYVGRFVGDTSTIAAFQFLGDRSFTKSVGGAVTRTGEELRGRSVKLETGDKITIIDETDFFNDRESGTQTQPWVVGWKFDRTSKTGGVTLQGGEIAYGDIVRMQDNLPDMNFVELLKAVAAATGFVLNYTDENGITFESLNFASWPIIDITGIVTNVGEMARKFGDYARNNIVEYDSDESVPDAMRLRAVYQIDNDNIAEDNTLQTVPFSEGRSTMYEGERVLLVADENQKDVLGDTRTTAASMVNVALNKIAGLQTLCDSSTSITVSVRMTLAQYESVHAKTIILYAGTRYVWTEATWSNGIATIKISKI